MKCSLKPNQLLILALIFTIIQAKMSVLEPKELKEWWMNRGFSFIFHSLT